MGEEDGGPRKGIHAGPECLGEEHEKVRGKEKSAFFCVNDRRQVGSPRNSPPIGKKEIRQFRNGGCLILRKDGEGEVTAKGARGGVGKGEGVLKNLKDGSLPERREGRFPKRSRWE